MNSNVFLVFILVAFASTVRAKPTERSDKPAFDCPTKERYVDCSYKYCYSICGHLANSPPCAMIAPDCFHPECICEENHLRNAKGICIPYTQCPEYKKGMVVY